MKKIFLIFFCLFSCQKESIIPSIEEKIIEPINLNGIPITYIITDNDLEIDSKDEYRTGTISIKGGQLSSDFPVSEMKIRGCGNSTWVFHDKKPYQLKLSEKASFLDLPRDKKWIFLAEHSDKTLMQTRSHLKWAIRVRWIGLHKVLIQSYTLMILITERIMYLKKSKKATIALP